ncbi:MAG: lysylphosphatidylglycerol synthase transmembrane domain-containing protein [Caldimonas sp.]
MPRNTRLTDRVASDTARGLWVRRRWFLAAVAALYIACGVIAFRLLDRSTLERALSLPLTLVAALLALSLVNYLVRAWRWLVLSSFLGFNVPPLRNVLYYLAGYALTATPGKAGEAVRLWFLKAGHGVPYARSMAIMLADRALDMWAVLILVLVCFADFSRHLWQGLAMVAIIIVMSVPIIFPRMLMPLLGLGLRLAPKRRRLWVRARRAMHSMADLSHWRTYGLTLVPSVMGWAAEGLALYLLLRFFGADVSAVNAVFVFSFSMIVGASSMLPGGLGSTEVTAVLLLRALGVDFDAAVASTALVRVTTFWFAVGIGVCLLPVAIKAASRSGELRLAAQPRGSS